MKFYTSYFGNISKTDSDRYIHLSVARFTPDFFKDRVVERKNYKLGSGLAPSKLLLADMKDGKITEDEYKKRYATEVFKFITESQKMSIPDYIKAIEDEFGNDYDGIIFYCYEKPGDFCHRHILARIFELNGKECTEIGEEKLNNSLF